MSETPQDDPWANVFQTAMEGGWPVYYADEVNAARAAVERQHAEELADCAQAHATERDLAIAVVTARHVDELAKKDDALGRWLQTGLTLMKFFGAAPRMAEADMPDFLWREVPALIRSLRNTLRDANAENATLRAQVETLTAERQSLLRDVFTKAADIEALRASLAAVEGERDQLREALRMLRNECAGIRAMSYDEIRASAGYTNLSVWIGRIEQADATLAALTSPTQETTPATVCRTCLGSGFIAVKQSIGDGWGEVDSCPDCADKFTPTGEKGPR